MDKPDYQAGFGRDSNRIAAPLRKRSLISSFQRQYGRIFWSVLLALVCALAASWAMAAKYIYDSNGRLVVVTNESGQNARYVYDKLGNLLRIDRLAADELAVFAFSPSRGAVGTQVTLQGQGFGASVSQNQVAFNGATATVISASPTELVAQVPVGATTGPVSVAVGSQVASAPSDFVVDENAYPPLITDVNPLVTSIGTSVNVTGSRLYPAVDQTRVSLSGRLAITSSISNTQLAFPVPAKANSGKITVSTLYGLASSTQDVIVAPSGIATTDVVPAGRLSFDGPVKTVSALASNQWIGLLFDGEASVLSSLQFSNLAGNVSYTLYGPDNTSVMTGTVGPTSTTLHLPRLTAVTYLLLMKPVTAPTSWSVALERNKTLVADGDVIATPSTSAYQSKRFLFSALPGQNLGLGISDFVIGGTTGGSSSVYVYDGAGTQIAYQSCYQSYAGCDLNLPNLVGGSYTVVVIASGSGNATMSFKATLSSEVIATLLPDAPYALNIARRGQNARFAFSATAGQTIALRAASQVTMPANQNVYYTVYKPDGSVLQSAVYSPSGTLNLPSLPVTGTYTVFVDPYYGSTEIAQITLVSGVAETLTADGDVRSLATATTGQNAYLTFTATPGQSLGLGLSDFLISGGTSGSVIAYVYRPDGSQLTYQYCYPSNGGCELNFPGLMGGTYTVVVQAPNSGNGTMSFKATLSTDATTSLQSGSTSSLSLLRRGQNGRLTFAAAGGDTFAVRFANMMTVPVGRSLYYTAYKPDGSVLLSGSLAADGSLNLANLPTGGVYTLFVDPQYGAIATADVTLVAGVTGSAATSGEPRSYATATPDQNVYLTFDATPGQNLGLGLSDLMTPGSTSFVTVRVYRVDGDQLAYEYCYASNNGCDVNLPNLMGGTYQVVVSPPSSGNRTMSFQVAVSADVAVTLDAGTTYGLNLAARGQNGRLSFTATAGDSIALIVAGPVTAPGNRTVAYTIYKPDGSSLQSDSNTVGVSLMANQLPLTGTYQLFVDPSQGETLSAQIALSRAAKAESVLEVDGAGKDVTTSVAGQNAYFSFTATAGQNLGLGFADLITPGTTSSAAVYVYRADGSQVAYDNCYASYNGCDINLPNLAGGTYNVMVTPPTSGNRTMGFQAVLSSDVATTLQPDAAYSLALSRRGQNARLSFQGAVGQTATLSISSQTTSPTNRSVYYTIYKPDGSVLQSDSTTSSLTSILNSLPVDGTYQVVVDPAYGETATAQVLLSQGAKVAGGLQVDGASQGFTTQVPGQNVYFTFNATAGQNLGLGLSDLLTPGSTGYVAVYVYRPDGSQVAYDNCYAANNGCDVNLPSLMAGTYSVVVIPPTTGNRTLSFQATVSADITGTLQSNTAYALNLARPGQNARMALVATAGQTAILAISGQATMPAGRTVYYTVYKPDGSVLQSSGIYTSTGTLSLTNLPVSGTYTVFVDPYYGETETTQLTQSGASGTPSAPPPSDQIPTDGSAIGFSTQTAGQSVSFSFVANAGQNLGLGISDLLTPGAASWESATVYVYRLDGSLLDNKSCYASNNGCELNLPNLMGGTYRVVITPTGGGTRTLSFQISLSPDVADVLQPGTAYNLSLARRGQNGRLTFAATQGQSLALNVTSQATVPASRNVIYAIYKPDGSSLQSAVTTSSSSLVANNLPMSGTYTLFVDPYYGATATAQLQLFQANKAEGTLQSDASTATFATQVAGQNAYFTFNATAGQNLGLGISDLLTPGAAAWETAQVLVYRRDGTQVASESCNATNNGCDVNLSSLSSGTYSVIVTPPSNRSMSFKATLSADVVSTLQPDVAYSLNLARPGQNGRLAFAANAGQTIALTVTSQTTSPANRYVYYTINKPDGTFLQSGASTSGLTLVTNNLPVSGSYQVFVDPGQGETAAASVTLTRNTKVEDTLEVDGVTKNFATQVWGQYAYMTFTATQGQSLGLGISDLVIGGSTTGSSMVYVYRADGTQLAYQSCYTANSGCSLNLPNLMGGTYSVVVQSPDFGSRTMSFKASLSSEVATGLQPDTPYDLVIGRRGQNARLTFAASAGQTVAWRIANQTTVPANQNVYYTVYKPDGSVLQTTTIKGDGIINLPGVPMSGTYRVFVAPNYGATISARVTLASGITGTLVPNGATQSYATTTSYQNIYLSFTAATGQNLGLALSDVLTSTATGPLTVYINRADGTQLAYQNCYAQYGGCDIDLSNLLGGTYSVVITPPTDGDHLMSFQAVLSNDVEATLQPDVAYSLNVARRGQNGRLSFTANAGQSMTLNVGSQVTTPASQIVSYTVYKPDGSAFQSLTVASSGALTMALPASGTYSVLVDPNYGAMQTSQITLH